MFRRPCISYAETSYRVVSFSGAHSIFIHRGFARLAAEADAQQIVAVLFAVRSLIAVVETAFAAAPVPVTNCGQDVKGVGILDANLDCSAVADDSVNLNGRLMLNDFTLTGNPRVRRRELQDRPLLRDGTGDNHRRQ